MTRVKITPFRAGGSSRSWGVTRVKITPWWHGPWTPVPWWHWRRLTGKQLRRIDYWGWRYTSYKQRARSVLEEEFGETSD